MLSVILPSYNEEENIARTSETLKNILEQNRIPFELIFVNDGSRDRTGQLIREEAEKDARVVGVQFSRNFGKEACIFAGLRQSAGDCCAVMDCDLQHPPETLVEMYRLWEQGYEVVEGVKSSRGEESILHTLFARGFYKIIGACTNIDENSSDFKLMDRKVVDVLCGLTEKTTFFRALSFWVGFKSTRVSYEVQERKFGTSKWSFKSLVKYAVANVTAFSAMPLHFVTFCGGILIFFFVVMAIQTFVHWCRGMSVEGFTTVILLQLLIGGGIMLALGVIGYYIAKIFDEVKNRPQYIISKIDRIETDREKKHAD